MADPALITQVAGLLGTGAGAAATAAAGEAGKSAMGKVLARFKESRPQESERLAEVLQQLGVLAAAFAEQMDADPDLDAAVEAWAAQVNMLSGINVTVHGDVTNQANVHDVHGDLNIGR